MNIEQLNQAYTEIENFRCKVGEVFLSDFMEDDNSSYEIAKSIINVFNRCITERDFSIADSMLIAICGYSFDTLIKQIKEKDESGYHWESC